MKSLCGISSIKQNVMENSFAWVQFYYKIGRKEIIIAQMARLFNDPCNCKRNPIPGNSSFKKKKISSEFKCHTSYHL
ncbi:hypothetical protein EUGRSUZ_F02469 [Eucalyptus grandis]|uniref:Uncharacterized protein n=2 Tax=Eucalyptus grandis TaxID=71139 RepID=A0ACC3KI28_EUCGR|nr:hypothetical protein EUGRSUZ_F02469 [Eucalyptus grandis]